MSYDFLRNTEKTQDSCLPLLVPFVSCFSFTSTVTRSLQQGHTYPPPQLLILLLPKGQEFRHMGLWGGANQGQATDPGFLSQPPPHPRPLQNSGVARDARSKSAPVSSLFLPLYLESATICSVPQFPSLTRCDRCTPIGD